MSYRLFWSFVALAVLFLLGFEWRGSSVLLSEILLFLDLLIVTINHLVAKVLVSVLQVPSRSTGLESAEKAGFKIRFQKSKTVFFLKWHQQPKDNLFRPLQNISALCGSYRKTKATLLCPSTNPLLLIHISGL